MKSYEIRMSRSRWFNLIIVVLLVALIAMLCSPYFTYGDDTSALVPKKGNTEHLLLGTWELKFSDDLKDGYKEIVFNDAKNMTVKSTNIIRINQLAADEAAKQVLAEYNTILSQLEESNDTYQKAAAVLAQANAAYKLAETARDSAPADTVSEPAATPSDATISEPEAVPLNFADLDKYLKSATNAADNAIKNHDEILKQYNISVKALEDVYAGGAAAYTADASYSWVTEQEMAYYMAVNELIKDYTPDEEYILTDGMSLATVKSIVESKIALTTELSVKDMENVIKVMFADENDMEYLRAVDKLFTVENTLTKDLALKTIRGIVDAKIALRAADKLELEEKVKVKHADENEMAYYRAVDKLFAVEKMLKDDMDVKFVRGIVDAKIALTGLSKQEIEDKVMAKRAKEDEMTYFRAIDDLLIDYVPATDENTLTKNMDLKSVKSIVEAKMKLSEFNKKQIEDMVMAKLAETDEMTYLLTIDKLLIENTKSTKENTLTDDMDLKTVKGIVEAKIARTGLSEQEIKDVIKARNADENEKSLLIAIDRLLNEYPLATDENTLKDGMDLETVRTIVEAKVALTGLEAKEIETVIKSRHADENQMAYFRSIDKLYTEEDILTEDLGLKFNRGIIKGKVAILDFTGQDAEDLVMAKLAEEKAIAEDGAKKATSAANASKNAAKDAAAAIKKVTKGLSDSEKQLKNLQDAILASLPDTVFEAAPEVEIKPLDIVKPQYTEYDNASSEPTMMETKGTVNYRERKDKDTYELVLTFANGDVRTTSYSTELSYDQKKQISILSYIGFPYEAGDFDAEMAYKINNFYINDIVLVPILLLVLAVIGIVMCIIKRDHLFSGVLPAILGVIGVIGYLASDFLKLGDKYVIHILLLVAILLVSALHITFHILDKKKKTAQ